MGYGKLKRKLNSLLLSPVAYLVINALGGYSAYGAELSISCYADSTSTTFRCGEGTTASDKSSIAVGSNVSASGVRAIAIGAPDNAINSSTPSIVQNTTAAADGIAIGSGATVTTDGVGGVAIGSRRHDPNTGAVLNGAPMAAQQSMRLTVSPLGQGLKPVPPGKTMSVLLRLGI
ncbi:hypothetical protein ABI58_23480 [Salmonella enterica subsp. enterica serovar Salford]|nr:hypothetical protein ABI58_23480 [Salmonella enterica subsp. enterica serovar Salford]